MLFRNEDHQKFYEAAAERIGRNGEKLALVYLIGLSDCTRENWRACYDIENDDIKLDCVNAGWQTGGSRRAIKLGFALYMWTTIDVVDIFCECDLYPYFIEAMNIRFNHLEKQERKWTIVE